MYSESEDMQWESKLMLKEPRWSVSKGIKKASKFFETTLTPLIIRHDKSHKTADLMPQTLNITGDDEFSDMVMDLEEGRIGNSNESTPNDEPNLYLKGFVTVECIKMNESKFHGVINYTEAIEKLLRQCTPDNEFVHLNFQANLNQRLQHHTFMKIQNYSEVTISC